MMRRKFVVDDLRNLSLIIHTIGYPDMGEAILTMICDGDSVLFTTLTDCYLTPQCNQVAAILDEKNVSVDVFIWTHPDKDHSVGIKDILDKYDGGHDAQIFLPEEFHDKISYEVCQESLNTLKYLKENYNNGKKYNISTVGVTEKETRSLIQLQFEEAFGEKSIHCSWQFMAPFCGLTWRQASKENFVLNDLSIVYSMYFNGVNFLFGGDLAERSIKFMDDQYMQNVHFIKIPHHGSDIDNKAFIRKMQACQVENALAVTTSYKSTHPYPQTLESYKKISNEIDCTGDKNHNQCLYGCVKASFNICSLAYETDLSGNAFCHYHA